MSKDFHPLLSATIEDTSKLAYPAIVSPKLDGIRCLIIDGVAVSRNLKPIRNKHVQALFGRSAYNGLDGELIVGDPCSKTCYRDTNSGVMSEDGEPDVRFHVFDRFNYQESFSRRFASLPHDGDFERIVRVPHRIVSDETQLLEIENEYLEMGYEGLMVRSPNGSYKQGRSTLRDGILGKLKRMASDEAEIIGVIELERNMNEATINALGHMERSSHQENKVKAGTMGALAVRCVSTGAEFKIGTGFTPEDRDWFWANRETVLRQLVTYNHFPIGRKDLPRFPSYKGLRSREDM